MTCETCRQLAMSPRPFQHSTNRSWYPVQKEYPAEMLKQSRSQTTWLKLILTEFKANKKFQSILSSALTVCRSSQSTRVSVATCPKYIGEWAQPLTSKKTPVKRTQKADWCWRKRSSCSMKERTKNQSNTEPQSPPSKKSYWDRRLKQTKKSKMRSVKP